MILFIVRFQRTIALLFYFIFCFSFFGNAYNHVVNNAVLYNIEFPTTSFNHHPANVSGALTEQAHSTVRPNWVELHKPVVAAYTPTGGGPSQPEMATFKSVNTDNLVDLFTGDFSYNIPLLDVGGYPINLHYNGGIGVEDEASWVGLGWNINPGNINRNTRGIPDDFNGNDTLIQTQNIKPNKTWGVNVDPSLEIFGFKLPATVKLGVEFNNYLGPSLRTSVVGNFTSAFIGLGAFEKNELQPNVQLGVSASSRYGSGVSVTTSLPAILNKGERENMLGVSLSTDYNSRTGIKSLTISEQNTFVRQDRKNVFQNQLSFLKPAYTPSLRLPIANTAYTGRFKFGFSLNGTSNTLETEVYSMNAEVPQHLIVQKKPMVGYMYYEQSNNNKDYVQDFNRMNDKEVTATTTIVAAPQYTYDVFSILGEGTGGNFRAFRNDWGYVRDNFTRSTDKSYAAGIDIGTPSHVGADFSHTKIPTSVGEWVDGNKLKNTQSFLSSHHLFENVYFKNTSEKVQINEAQLNRVGGANLVRYVTGGSNVNPTIEPVLAVYDRSNKKTGTLNLFNNDTAVQRNKRAQVIQYLTAEMAASVGLDKKIKSYSPSVIFDSSNNSLMYETIDRVDPVIRKKHHLSEIDVTESDGKRYIYGLPVYTHTQTDFTFSVAGGNINSDKVAVEKDWYNAVSSSMFSNSSLIDGYVQCATTPGYAHSFLLSGILSPDYADITGNGITPDDLGTAIKFNYTQIKNGSSNLYKWRTPLTKNDSANFMPGAKSEQRDDKGFVAYGERESWYLHSVESKAMIALFYTSNRLDRKGAIDCYGGIDSQDSMTKKLDSIGLYNKADLIKHGLKGAKCIKMVHFNYNYQLCQNTPDNISTVTGNKGKLTLQSIYFTFNGNKRTQHVNRFYYTSNTADSVLENPDYSAASSDRWGNYKPAILNPGKLSNADYPYTIQDATKKNRLDAYSSAWMLRRIVMPSGGEMNIQYESDDYAFVQHKKAMQMMQVVGFSNSSNYETANNTLYGFGNAPENDYVFIQVNQPCKTTKEVFDTYLSGTTQLAIKSWVNMPKGPEYIATYAEYVDYGVTKDPTIIWVQLKRLNGFNPVSITALEYLRQQLPGQAFPGYDIKGAPPLQQVGAMLINMLGSLKELFSNPVASFKAKGKARYTDLSKSFIRLNQPTGYKLGGGYRVKSVTMNDNWNKMTGQYSAVYGQVFQYNTESFLHNANRVISSGVASYEPSIGNDENPFQTMILSENAIPAGPTSYGSIEMPVLDAFFHSPTVGYSKVMVSSIHSNTGNNNKLRSGIGKQVTEYFTAKDYPVYYNHTALEGDAVKELHDASLFGFLNHYTKDFKDVSQGFVVINNDMHGQLKSRASFAENDTATPISRSTYYYKNTGFGDGVADSFDFLSPETGNTVVKGKIGIDIDFMTDVRHFSVEASNIEFQAQVDLLGVLPIASLWPIFGTSQNIYKAVTVSKVLNYHSILDSIVVTEKGSTVSTKNLVYDAYSGNVLINKTQNEFNRNIYQTVIPAYWAYKGMGPAAKNCGMQLRSAALLNGALVYNDVQQTDFESGDELYVVPAGAPTNLVCDTDRIAPLTPKLWAIGTSKVTVPSISTATVPYIFVDDQGTPYNRDNLNLTLVRSGYRNMLSHNIASYSSINHPIVHGNLLIDQSTGVLSATTSVYTDQWQVDKDVIKKFITAIDNANCSVVEKESLTGNYENKINPYVKGLLGNYRKQNDYVFYENRKETDITAPTAIAENGLLNNFSTLWKYGANQYILDTTNKNWVWLNQLNKVNARGLELEQVNALGIYQSAQYGYLKNLPVAMAQNARYSEMMVENFEDYGYSEFNKETLSIYGDRKIDFSRLSGGLIVNTDTTHFAAHSGKYVLGLKNAAASIVLPFEKDTDVYDLKYTSEQSAKLIKGATGTNFSEITLNNVVLDAPNKISSKPKIDGGVWNTLMPRFVTNYTYNPNEPFAMNFGFSIGGYQYIKIDEMGVYAIKFETVNRDNAHLTLTNSMNFTTIQLMDTVHQTTLTGTELPVFENSAKKIRTIQFCLQPGIYKLYTKVTASRSFDCAQQAYKGYCMTNAFTDGMMPVEDYFIQCNRIADGKTVQLFKDYTIDAHCKKVNPPSGKAEFLHQSFHFKPGKKMVLSAWVREECGNEVKGIPCNDYTYIKNAIEVGFDQNTSAKVTITPSGPIIDGWQRYEGVFVVPNSFQEAQIQLVNKSSGTIYFDDVRIHPYNANMKSYVYDPVNLRLMAELDENNYCTFFEYDEEGELIRKKVETKEGVKTVIENRSALQKVIN